MANVKYVKLASTVIVTVNGRTYPVAASHPLYNQIVEAIRSEKLEEVVKLVEHNDRQDFKNRLRLKPR